jgi:hypothetical protein
MSRTPATSTDTASQADHSDLGDTSTTTSRPNTSWVWKFFEKLPNKPINKCIFSMADGSICEKELARDKKGSTSSMKNHLETKHRVYDGKVPDQGNIIGAFKKAKTGHVVSFASSERLH